MVDFPKFKDEVVGNINNLVMLYQQFREGVDVKWQELINVASSSAKRCREFEVANSTLRGELSLVQQKFEESKRAEDKKSHKHYKKKSKKLEKEVEDIKKKLADALAAKKEADDMGLEGFRNGFCLTRWQVQNEFKDVSLDFLDSRVFPSGDVDSDSWFGEGFLVPPSGPAASSGEDMGSEYESEENDDCAAKLPDTTGSADVLADSAPAP